MKNIKLIHIGKCGGTFIGKKFKLNEYHHSRNYQLNDKYIIWIRNPIKRFVSAFYFSYNIIHTDTTKLNINNLNLNNCLAPQRIKMKQNYAFTPRYDF